MDKKLQIVERVYGEGTNHVSVDQIVADDPGLRREYADMSSVRKALDDLPAVRPDSGVIDAIEAAAAAKWKKPTTRPWLRAVKIPPALLAHSTTWKFAVAASVVLLAAVVSIPLMRTTPIGQELAGKKADESNAVVGNERFRQSPTTSSEDESAPLLADTPSDEAFESGGRAVAKRGDAAEPEREEAGQFAVDLAEADLDAASFDNKPAPASELDLADRVEQVGASKSTAVGDDLAPAEEQALRLWDDIDDMRRIQGRIEALHASSVDLEWGQPAMPLEMLPGGNVPTGFEPQTVGSRRQ